VNFLIKIIDYLFLTRPVLMLPIWATYFAGIHGLMFGEKFNLFHEPPIASLNFWSFSALIGAFFVMNQIADIKTDAINRKLYILPEGKISKFGAWIFTIGLLIFSFWQIDVLTSPRFFLFFMALIILGFGYNFHPVRWSARPFAGFFTHIFGAVFCYSIGWLDAGGTFSFDVLISSIPIVCGFCAIYLLTTIPDADGDKKTDKITFSVRFGKIKTLNFALVLMILSFGFAIYFQDNLVAFAAFASTVMIGKARIYFNQNSDFLQAIRFSILYLLIAMSLQFPILFVLTAIVVVASRLYYLFRFQKKYPVMR